MVPNGAYTAALNRMFQNDLIILLSLRMTIGLVILIYGISLRTIQAFDISYISSSSCPPDV